MDSAYNEYANNINKNACLCVPNYVCADSVSS